MNYYLSIQNNKKLQGNFESELRDILHNTAYQHVSSLNTDIRDFVETYHSLYCPTSTESFIALLRLYYIQLSNLQKVIPDENLEFVWNINIPSLISDNEDIIQHFTSIVVERNIVLYDIGTIYSQLAKNLLVGQLSTETARKACLYFQKSSGCFEEILKNLKEGQNNIFDKKILQSLIYITLGEAQECSWFIANRSGHTDSILSKLAFQIVQYYKKALDIIDIGSVSPKINVWVQFCQFKVNYFMSVASYRSGTASINKNQHGKAISFLNLSVKYLNMLEDTPDIIKFQQVVTTLLENETRDNELLHFQNIPSLTNAEGKLKAASLVKIANIDSIIDISNLKGNTNIFNDFIPLKVLESCKAYEERKVQYMNDNIIDPIRQVSNKLQEYLVKNSQSQLLDVIDSKEISSCNTALSDLTQNNQTILKEVISLERFLDEEIATSKKRFKNFGLEEDSTQERINYFTKKFQNIHNYLKEGKSINNQTIILFNHLDYSFLINNNKDELTITDPILLEIHNKIIQRKKFIKSMENIMLNQDLLPKLIATYEEEGTQFFETIFREYLENFKDDIKYVVSEEGENIRFKHALEELTRTRDINNAKNDSIHDKTILQYFNVRRNIKEGTKFYADIWKSTMKVREELSQFIQEQNDIRAKKGIQHNTPLIEKN